MAYMEIVEGFGRGKINKLAGETPIGRSIEQGISLPDSEVSRSHAIVRLKENYYTLTDCGSANGTFINGRALHRFVPQPLYQGDEITICSTTLKFVSEGQDPLSLKKTLPGVSSPFGEVSKLRGVGGLSMILTSETGFAPVSATMDASRSALETPALDEASVEDPRQTVDRLRAMVSVSNNLNALTNPEALVEKIMESIFDLFPQADRAFIMLRDKQSKEMIPKLGRSRSDTAAQEDFPISHTIISAVIEKKQSILSSDAQKDGRFLAGQSIVNLSIRSLMCAPFICNGELLGIISIDTMSSAQSFNTQDLAMLTSIAGQAAIALKNADLFVAIERETHVRAQLSRYLSKDVVEGVIDGTIPLQLGGATKYGTVFFCDIVGFTAMAEHLSAVEVVEKLNRYFSITTEIITRNKGTLHKFGGDMIMAFWNVMVPDSHAQLNAIRASVEMQTAIWKFDAHLKTLGQAPLYLGIGCNTGEFAGGNVGGEDCMEYTIIGDNVNLAQRIESLASRWQVFVAQSTYEPTASHCCAVKMPVAQVKGKSAGIQVYSVRGIQCDPGKMFLTIPIAIVGEHEAAYGRGMLVRFNNADASLVVCVEEDAVAHDTGSVRLQFDLPELSECYELRGTIRSVKPFEQGIAGATIILEELSGDEALAFLRPGSCIESQKAWEEMKRH